MRGEVGKPIKIRPLLNDLPGSDPNNPNAELSLGGKVPQQPGAKIVSDLDAGPADVHRRPAGTYFLELRRRLRQRHARPGHDPGGREAAPQARRRPDRDARHADGLRPGAGHRRRARQRPRPGRRAARRPACGRRPERQLDVAIIDGRWLRISSRAAQPHAEDADDLLHDQQRCERRRPGRGRRHPAAGARGQHPITVTDRVVVRAGAAVSAPVLDNDVSPAGDRLDAGQRPRRQRDARRARGRRPLDVTGDVGKAFVSGRRSATSPPTTSRSATPSTSPTSRRTSTAGAPTGRSA